MNADVEKAVDELSREIADPEDCTAWQTILAALRDQDAEIARLDAAWNGSFQQALKNGQRALQAEALLRECDAVARKRGDKYGLCDAIDNNGQPYQSQFLADHLGATP